MIRSILFRGPIFATAFPIQQDSLNNYDKPKNPVTNPLLKDELAWDRIKRIFKFNEDGMMTKELQSIMTITFSGTLLGLCIGGMSGSKFTVDNFIMSNEATKFSSHFDAKRTLQQLVFENFLKKGFKYAGKLGLFCFMFSTVTTCATAYQGRLTITNYIIGGSTAGFLYKMNLGLRGALAGAVTGSALGGICGIITTSILYLTGVSMDEILDVQQNWITSRNEKLEEKIKNYMAEHEETETRKLYESNQILREKHKNAKDCDT